MDNELRDSLSMIVRFGLLSIFSLGVLRRLATLSMAGLAFASPIISQEAGDAKARKADAVRVLSRGDSEAGLRVLDDLLTSGPMGDAFDVLLDVTPVLVLSYGAAVSKRDSQGKRLFRHFESKFKLFRGGARWTTLGASERHKTMLRESRDLNREVVAKKEWLSRVVKTIRRMIPLSPQDVSAMTLQFREALNRAKRPRVRENLLASIPVDLVSYLVVPILFSAREGRTRGERLIALECLARDPVVDEERLDCLDECLADEDPFVRRAAVDVLAKIGTRDAMNRILARLGKESGVPRRELVDHLRRLSGEDRGTLSVRWNSWWEEAKASWSGPRQAVLSKPADSTGQWRYFGLQLDSKRVVFVLDISGSMARSVDYSPSQGFLRQVGRVKMDVAREELFKALIAFDEDTTFNIVAYNTKVEVYSRRMVSATQKEREKAREWVAELKPETATNTMDSLRAAFAMTRGGSRKRDRDIADTVLFLSDGEPTCGSIPGIADILDEVQRLNPRQRVAVHCIHLGNEDGVEFMRELAARTGGQLIQVR